MRVAVAADERVGIAGVLIEALRARGHEVIAFGALAREQPLDGAWARASEAAARAVAERRVEQAVICCWTGTGASIAANKVAGVRAALCADAATAAGARRWNDANVLALSLRCTAEAELQEILDAWFATEASDASEDRENVAHLVEIERRKWLWVERRKWLWVERRKWLWVERRKWLWIERRKWRPGAVGLDNGSV